MKDFTRPDEGMALAVDTAIKMATSSGCLLTWQYLQMHAVPKGVATRVLSQNGPRRASTSNGRDMLREQGPANGEEGAEQATKLAATGLRTVLKFRLPRTNITLSETIDQAIEMMGVHNRFYAEALLRIHAVQTPVIMRVLFDAARRRSIASPTIPLAPARGIRLLHSV
ncbi:hypothetical protein [Duganella sp. Root1480D1]|uniref:hypothetical protein n=1 Tax=Duganella sp. Root1480D1 TaxID=1736471 RepID=UPI000710E5C2|nr:hypothetical protein [Duganella sp. Root1480D1]KQZ32378.1 hypothetical protein ASD58_06960 [Duganella sp. Root1480D1]